MESIGQQSNSLTNTFKSINETNYPNKSIPIPSNYGNLNEQEKESLYFISRYPSGLININNNEGGEFKNYQSNTNMTYIATKNINNLKPNPTIKIKYPSTDYTIEGFTNFKNINKINILFFIFIIIIIIWMNTKLFK